MHIMSTSSSERALRERIASGSLNAEDYLAFASLLYHRNRFDESINTLRGALRLPLPNPARATLLTALGRYVNDVTGDRQEPASLGEQASALMEGLDTVEAVLAKAKGQALIADCSWMTDPDRAAAMAISALSQFRQATDASANIDREALFYIHLEAARLNHMLDRSAEAAKQCEQALQLAPDESRAVACRTELGTIYRDAGRLTEARDTLIKAVNSSEAAPYALVRPYFELGLTERALGKLPEARAKLQRALASLQDDPALPRRYFPELLRMIGDISFELDDVGAAADAFQAASEAYAVTDAFYWSCLGWLAFCQWNLGQFEMARANAERVAGSSAAPEDKRDDARYVLRGVKLDMAQDLYDSDDCASCVAECEALLPQFEEGDDSYLRLLLLLGHSHLYLGDKPAARKYYKAVLASPAATPAHRTNAERGLANLSAPRK
jgi:tetratricopeptide (TPR) repeat protein